MKRWLKAFGLALLIMIPRLLTAMALVLGAAYMGGRGGGRRW